MGNFSVSSSGASAPLYRPQAVPAGPELDGPPEVGDDAPTLGMDTDTAEPAAKGESSQLAVGNLAISAPGGGMDLLGDLDGPLTQHGAGVPASDDPKNYRFIERDLPDVNARDPVNQEDLIDAMALKPEDVSAAVGKLDAAQQAKYKQLQDFLIGQPAAQAAIDKLAVDGKLTQIASHGESLLDTLDGLTRQPLAPGLDRKVLVGDLTKELALPKAINQQDHGTCAVTSIEIKLALENPAEMAHLVAGLASPKGSVMMADGETLKRSPGSEKDDKGGRTDSSRLLQAALMDFGNGKVAYNNKKDLNEGLVSPEEARVMSSLFGKPMTERSFDVPEVVQKETAAGKAVPVGLDWDQFADNQVFHGKHMVLVTRIENDKVYYDNPWGKEESMSLADFKLKADVALVPVARTPQPAPGGDADLVRDRDIVLSNIDEKLKEVGARRQAAMSEKNPQDSRAGVYMADHYGALLGEIKLRVAGIKLPDNPSDEDRAGISDTLGDLSARAMTLDEGNVPISDLESSVHKLEQFGVKQ